MALSQDQKKHLMIGGGLGALTVFLGSMIFGGRKAHAGLLHGGHGGGRHEDGEHHDKRRDDGGDNDRGEYGDKKKHHHKEHGHGD